VCVCVCVCVSLGGGAALLRRFRSMPVAPLGGSRPLWATVSERQVGTRRRSTSAATKYGHLPTGTSRPAAFSTAVPKGGKIPEGLQNAKPKEMPRLVQPSHKLTPQH
jgi:hypothetical protein